MSWRKHLRPGLAQLEIYDVPPSDAPTRLHANECPEPWPPAVLEALGREVAGLELNRYPDTSGRELRALLGAKHGVDPDRVVLGNGSDEVISILLTALSRGPSPAPLVVPTPTFVMYAHTATVLDVPVREVPLDARFGLDLSAMRAALPGAASCFLARPNNPTSSLFEAGQVLDLVREFPDTIFVLDEAYAAYLGRERAPLWTPDGPDNLVLMTTLSKVGLAALRLGYCIAHPELATALNKVRHPYNISATSLALATAVLRDHEAVQDAMIDAAIANRARLVELLRGLPATEVYPAHGNLVLARLDPPTRAQALVAALAERGIRIKDQSKVAGLEGCVRVSVGTSVELDHLAQALGQLEI